MSGRATSFYYSFLVLPPEKRAAIIAVWDFCRAVDDAVDEPDGRDPGRTLSQWREELAHMYEDGRPATVQGRQLLPFIRQFRLPRSAFEDLIADLSASCPIFDRLWALAEVVGTHEAIVTHPRGPGFTFEHSSYVPEGSPKQRLIIFTPCNEASAAKVREALAESKQSGRRPSAQVN